MFKRGDLVLVVGNTGVFDHYPPYIIQKDIRVWTPEIWEIGIVESIIGSRVQVSLGENGYNQSINETDLVKVGNAEDCL